MDLSLGFPYLIMPSITEAPHALGSEVLDPHL